MTSPAVPSPIDLLLLPCAGASATMYLRWRRSLPAWIRLVPLELPGRGARHGEPFVEDYDVLVGQLCDAVDAPAVAPTGRYVLLGHSMGALLAHGLARRLRERSRPLPDALNVSASAAPAMRESIRFQGPLDDASLIADLRRQGGTPDAVFENPELLRMTLDALAADYRVCASFRHEAPGVPLPMPVHVLAGRADAIPPASLAAWAAETTGRFTLDWFDGGHFFIRQQESLVLAALERALRPLASGASHAGVVAA